MQHEAFEGLHLGNGTTPVRPFSHTVASPFLVLLWEAPDAALQRCCLATSML